MTGENVKKVLLILSALAAGYCIIGLQIKNGTFDILAKITSESPRRLPGSDELLVQQYTSIRPLDFQLKELVTFFWPVVSGELPELSLFGAYMAAQIVPVQVLVLLEGLRMGNKGKVISYTTFWGCAYQSIPWGIMMPLYLALNLQASPAPSAFSGQGIMESITADPRELVVLPISILLGYVLPSVMMALPSPQFTTFVSHQYLIAAWQFFPIWIALSQLLVKRLLPTQSFITKNASRNQQYIYAARIIYIFGLLIPAIIQLSTLYVLVETRPFSLPLFNASTVFLPLLLSDAKVDSFAHGVLHLLQWDMIFACGAALLWASYLFYSVNTQVSWLGRVVKLVLLNVLFGPGGAALAMVWDRDEFVLRTMVENGTDEDKSK